MGKVVKTGSDVRALRSEKNLTQQEFATELGVSVATVRNWEQRDRLTKKIVAQIAVVFGGGAESENIASKKAQKLAPISGGVSWIPLVSVEASAGQGYSVTAENVVRRLAWSNDWLNQRGLNLADLYALTVRGDSMQPRLLDGYTIFIDTSDVAPRNDRRIFVFRYNNDVSVKWLHTVNGGIVVSASNDIYKPYTIMSEDPDDFMVIGRVWAWTGVDL